jgi:hypothetical protein
MGAFKEVINDRVYMPVGVGLIDMDGFLYEVVCREVFFHILY